MGLKFVLLARAAINNEVKKNKNDWFVNWVLLILDSNSIFANAIDWIDSFFGADLRKFIRSALYTGEGCGRR